MAGEVPASLCAQTAAITVNCRVRDAGERVVRGICMQTYGRIGGHNPYRCASKTETNALALESHLRYADLRCTLSICRCLVLLIKKFWMTSRSWTVPSSVQTHPPIPDPSFQPKGWNQRRSPGRGTHDTHCTRYAQRIRDGGH